MLEAGDGDAAEAAAHLLVLLQGTRFDVGDEGVPSGPDVVALAVDVGLGLGDRRGERDGLLVELVASCCEGGQPLVDGLDLLHELELLVLEARDPTAQRADLLLQHLELLDVGAAAVELAVGAGDLVLDRRDLVLDAGLLLVEQVLLALHPGDLGSQGGQLALQRGELGPGGELGVAVVELGQVGVQGLHVEELLPGVHGSTKSPEVGGDPFPFPLPLPPPSPSPGSGAAVGGGAGAAVVADREGLRVDRDGERLGVVLRRRVGVVV